MSCLPPASLLIPTHFIPAFLAARTPLLESSITRQFSGPTPSFSEAKINISGSGLLFFT